MSKIECLGRLAGASVAMDMEHLNISIQVPMQFRDQYESLKNIDALDIEIKQHRERRSLNANAYFRVLVGKLADVQGISKVKCKNILICSYGQQEFINDQEVVIKTNIPVEKMVEQEFLHCHPAKVEIQNGKEIIFYKVFRGSHTYNTKEMSILIDGTVQEAKEQGIETATPEQIHEMIQRWGVEFEKAEKCTNG